jgi:heptosyltransferase-2
VRTRGKILVIRGGAIGDFILTLPVLAALREQFPDTHLELMGYAHIAALAAEGGLVDAVHSIEARPLAGFFAPNAELDEDLGDYFSEFALIISYLYDPDEIFQTNIRRCSLAQFIAGPHRANEDLSIHATECLLQPLERLAIFSPDPVPRLQLGDRETAGSEPVLALHPGSGSEQKNWPEAKWRELLGRLDRESVLKFLIVGGEAEGDRLESLSEIVPADRAQIARNLPLPELGRYLAGCRAFIGHDSGISHLAAALGLPGVVLWGHTREEIWRPLSDQMRIVRDANGLTHLSVEQVFRELRKLI